METSKYATKDSCIIIIAINNNSFSNDEDAKQKFFSTYARSRYPIVGFIVVDAKKMDDYTLQFTESLSQGVQKCNLVEHPSNVSIQTEQLVKHFRETRKESQCPILNLYEYYNLAHKFGLESDSELKQSIVYLHQTGAGIRIEEFVVLDIEWLNSILCCATPKRRLSMETNGFLECSFLVERITEAFPDYNFDLQIIIDLLVSSKVVTMHENKILFPTMLPLIQDEKGAVWKGKFDACNFSYKQRFRLIPKQLVHRVAICIFERVIEFMNYECFLFFCLEEWTLKEPNGNFLFFSVNYEENELQLLSNSETSVFNELSITIDRAISDWQHLIARVKSQLSDSSSNWLSFK